MDTKGQKVVVAIPTNGNDGREQLAGVFDWMNEHPGWEVQLVNSRTDIASGEFKSAVDGAAGVILSIAYGNREVASGLGQSKAKVVVTNDHLVPLYAGRENCRTLVIDSVSVGRDAGRYICTLGRFASYGFVHGHIRFPWSIEREQGFREALPRSATLRVFPERPAACVGNEAFGDVGEGAVSSPLIPGDSLQEWLLSLPKPAAIFGANDLFAREVATQAKSAGLDVPRQVTIIGCDNDPLICTHQSPHLTSLALPFRALGYKAAETLWRLLEGRHPPRRTMLVGGTRLNERGSSRHLPPATALVEKAREYIAAHATEGIRAADVFAHIGVSRSLLDLRFREVLGKSVKEEILDVRLREVKRLLGESDLTILKIGSACGFNDPDNLKRLFRKRFGTTMGEWRRANLRAPNTITRKNGFLQK